MNKTIAAIALAVILCLLGAPFATGWLAEDRLRERIAAMDANNVWLTADVTSYERGWFTSVATVELVPVFGSRDDTGATLADIAGAGPFLDLVTGPVPVRVELAHGPVSFGESLHFGTAQIRARPDTADDTTRTATELLGVPYLFEFRGRAGFGGGFDFDADVPAFTYASALGETDFSGLTASGFADAARLTMAGNLDRVAFQSPFAAAALDAFEFDMTVDFRDDLLPVSRSTGSLGSLIATSPLLGAEPVLELRNLVVRQSVEVESGDETIGATMRSSSDLIATANGERVENVEIGIAATGIDAAAASAYYRIVSDSLSSTLGDPERLVAELQPVADAVVRRGFTVTLDPADFSTNLGAFAARADVRIDGSALPPGAAADIRNIAVLLTTLSIDANVTIAKPLATRLAALAVRPQLQTAGVQSGEPFSPDELDAAAEAQAGLMLVTLIGQGLIVDEGDSYVSSIRFADDRLTVNGAPLQPGLFF